jgi:alpha-L-rhamnosidase
LRNHLLFENLVQTNMVLSGDMDWHGSQWIGANGAAISGSADDFMLIERVEAGHYQSMRLRRELEVKPKLRQATLCVCGLGQYELTIDGSRVGEDLLTPGWTNYKKTCLYDTYDVTTQLQRSGRHALGLLLGNGMYNIEDTSRYKKFTGSFGPLKAIAQLRLEYSEGKMEIVGTDQNWRINSGPITYSHIFGGENYDGRLEAKGWDSPGFNDDKWDEAAVMDGPGGKLGGSSVAAPPIRAIEILKPTNVKELKQGISVYDLGQNATMMPLVKVHGPSGAMVRIIPAELVHGDGWVDRSSCGGGIAYWQYTLTGDVKGETYSPKFFYHACRYLQVELSGPEQSEQLPTVESLVGVVVHSTSEPVGEFSCSSDLFNKIYSLIRWAQRSNMVSYLTDCPHRERLGWLEQVHLNGPALRYNFRLDKLFSKMMNDMADSQLENGMLPSTAPEYAIFGGGFRDSPEWSSAFVLVPWQQYEFTGDTELLRKYYDRMAQYVAYLGSSAQDDIVSFGLSDWYDIGPGEPGPSKLTPAGVTGTAFYYQDTLILAQAATLLNRREDAARYQQQAERIRAAFHAKFFNAVTNQYATGSQCANSLAIVMGLVEPTNRAAVLDNIVTDIEEKGLTAGDVGFRYLLRALADGNRSDVVYKMNNQSDKPGYGMQIAKGATALTEAWDANPYSSQNHFMFGQINEWFFHDLAGIQSDPHGPGFRKVIIKPTIVGDLTWVKASYNSVHGKIISEWKRTSGEITFTTAIPTKTTGTVFIPTTVLNSVTEARRLVLKMEGVKFVKVEDGCAIYEIVVAGTYTFTVQNPDAILAC